MLEDWERLKVGDIATIVRGASPRPKGDPRYYGGDIPRLLVADVTRDGRYVTPSIDFLTSAGAALSRPMPKGTLTVVCSGYVGIPSILAVDACIHDGFLALKNVSPKAEIEFLYEVFSSLQLQFERSATHGGVFTNLTTEILRDFEFLSPPLVEQRRIARLLRAWDEGIGKVETLIRRKSNVFDSLARSLLTGRRRVTAKPTNWRGVSITDVTTELTARNGKRFSAEKVMGVNKLQGLIPMKDHVRATDLSRYKIVPPATFAYNPMRLNIGSLAMNHLGHDALVSPDYVVFSANEGELDAGFFDHLRRTKLWSQFVESAGSGGVRIRIYYEDLADFEFELPPISEQLRITTILDTARSEIELLEAKSVALKKQKRGLVQKLLTGEWRLPPGPSGTESAKPRVLYV
jgi:type I restriction enzyme S subunit